MDDSDQRFFKCLRGRPEGVPAEEVWLYFGIYVGQALHLARELEELSQEEVAERLTDLLREPVAQRFIDSTEAGEHHLSWPWFVAWCRVLNRKASEVIEIADSLARRENDTDEVIIDRIERKISRELGLGEG